MSSVEQRYHDISPVMLQVVGGAVSSSLYCGEVEGLASGLVESFLVELYRCKLCQFTCGLKASISSHLLFRHEGGGGAEDGGEAGLRRGASPYRLDLNEESKESNEEEDFLLYNMLDNMSPPTCDISNEGGLQVAHTCEVNTLFEEEEEEKQSSMFPLKEASVDRSCPIDPPSTQEEMAQSAHLMTLGLCRTSAAKLPPSPPLPAPSPTPPLPTSPQLSHRPPNHPSRRSQPSGVKQNQTEGRQMRTSSSSRRKLACLQCTMMLSSRRLLDVHIRSHRAAGGFSCICCSWTAASWEEMEPHWRSHCRRRRRRTEEEQRQERKKVSKPFSCAVCQRTFRSAASRNAHQQTHDGRSNQSGGWRSQLIRQAERKEVELRDSQTSSLQMEKKKKEEKKGEETGLCCSQCHRKFSTKLTLRRHLGTHRGDKPFTCPQCPYSSRLKASLLQHLRTHTGERPYRCAECPYASIDRSSLLRHSRTHSQEKPYSCQHCEYSSIQKKSLDLHARRHHTSEAFPCQQCEYSSPDRQLLLRHIRRHHSDDLTADQSL